MIFRDSLKLYPLCYGEKGAISYDGKRYTHRKFNKMSTNNHMHYKDSERFEPKTVLQAIDTEKPTTTCLAPPMLNTILLLPYETKHGDVGEVIFIGMAHDK